MKNTLPVVFGRFTFFDVPEEADLSPLEPTTPALLSAEAPPEETCLVGSVVSTAYGVALTRLALFWPYQKAATCLAAKLVLARVSCGTESAWAGAATTAEARRPTAMPPRVRVRFKLLLPGLIVG